MSAHKKKVEQMREGAMLERDRVMRIFAHVAKTTKEGLDKKLMSATEKHVADVKWRLVEGLLAALQMKVSSGDDPDAKAETTDLLG